MLFGGCSSVVQCFLCMHKGLLSVLALISGESSLGGKQERRDCAVIGDHHFQQVLVSDVDILE